MRFLVKVDNLYQSEPVTKSDYKSQKEHKNDDVRDLPRDLKGQDTDKRQGRI